MLYDFQMNIFSLEIHLGKQSAHTECVCLYTRRLCFSELADNSVYVKEECFCILASAWLALASFLEKKICSSNYYGHM